MEIEEFKFIYDDYKQQIKQLPPLQNLLRYTEKSIRKLECINLYSIADKRDFDLELEEQQIMQEIVGLHKQIGNARDNPTEEILEQISNKFQKVKDKNIETFDILNRQDELLTEQIQIAQYLIEEQHHNDEIKEEDEYEDEPQRDSKAQDENVVDTGSRVNYLKKQIDDILSKIAKINNGRGKWFQSDHGDFVKIYNKCGGNDKKIIEEGVKILGMKNTEIMDHLEIYENYLQLEKEKKLISEEYKQIKLYEKFQQEQKKIVGDLAQEQAKKIKNQKQAEQNFKKKEMVQKFKERKNQEKIKMLEQKQKEEKQKVNMRKAALPQSKKKEIAQRNKKFIETKEINFKKAQEKIQQEAKMAAMRATGSKSKYAASVGGPKLNSFKNIDLKSRENKKL